MAVGSASYAGLVTSLPGGTVDAMPGGNYFGGGPQVRIRRQRAVDRRAGTDGWNERHNRQHDICALFPGFRHWRFMNYDQRDEGTPTISVYNASDVLIESYALSLEHRRRKQYR